MSVYSILLAAVAATQWQHPAGMVTDETIIEVRDKVERLEWAKRVYESKRSFLEPWLDVPEKKLRAVFPKTAGNVYHTFSCPDDRSRLTFDPFDDSAFTCPTCEKVFPPETNAGVYGEDERYYGTVHDGWECLFYLRAPLYAVEMAIISRVEGSDQHADRALLLLELFAETIESLPTLNPDGKNFSRILTYHREGENKVLFDLAIAYELLRERMSPEEQARFEEVVLQRMLDDLMMEPIYNFDHNNIYQWHRTIIQVGLVLERDDLIDWSFGFGAYTPEALPEHRSLRRICATHFNDDGAFWELCSGYHLYPLHHFCELAVMSRNLSEMDPARFPAEQYDYTRPESDGGRVIKRALEWFVSLAMPDRTVTIIGDSMKARAGMDSYFTTAEVGYRYFDVKAVGDYPKLRAGKRTWEGLVLGADTIEQHRTNDTSAYLSSGWVSLRNEWRGNRSWVGLNAMIPGGGHQHADRLTFTWYGHEELLALEKATPYNEKVTRVLGTLTPSHNTVTVDGASQKQGEKLTEDEVPVVRYFHAGPMVQYAEIHGDNLYDQTSVYRRSVALIEGVAIDFFRVEGGTTHDWMLHVGDDTPELSVATTSVAFEPSDWVYNGNPEAGKATVREAWNAQWRVGDVTARMTMLGAPDTEVFQMETYPVESAFVTPESPACQSLCVRRRGGQPFLAVWDSWTDDPNVVTIEAVGDSGTAVHLTTRAHRYLVAFGAGRYQYGDTALETDAAFTVLRDAEALSVVGGATVSIESPEGTARVRADKVTTISIARGEGGDMLEVSPDVHYDTYGGRNWYRETAPVSWEVSGPLFKVDSSP